MSYITPNDMEDAFDQALLIQATNYSDRTAQTINQAILQKACESGSNTVDSYLAILGIPSDRYNSTFLGAIKVHAANLAMDYLAGTDPQIRDKAKESIRWLETVAKYSREQLRHLVTDPDSDPLPTVTKVLPSVGFNPGRSWEVLL